MLILVARLLALDPMDIEDKLTEFESLMFDDVEEELLVLEGDVLLGSGLIKIVRLEFKGPSVILVVAKWFGSFLKSVKELAEDDEIGCSTDDDAAADKDVTAFDMFLS